MDSYNSNTLKKNNNQIDALVFSGGGAKGAAYIGSLRCLNELNLIESIKTVSGASAGAITASFIACGIKGLELEFFLSKIDFKSQLGKRVPGTLFQKDAIPLEEFINSIHVLITTRRIDEILQDNSFMLSEHVNQFENIKKSIINDKKLTFKNLNALHSLKSEIFKKLYVNAITSPTGLPIIFNLTENDNDISVADAVRASGSIPGLMKPKEIKMNDINITCMDGGFYNNLPTHSEALELQEILNSTAMKNLLSSLDNANNPLWLKLKPLFIRNPIAFQDSLITLIECTMGSYIGTISEEQRSFITLSQLNTIIEQAKFASTKKNTAVFAFGEGSGDTTNITKILDSKNTNNNIYQANYIEKTIRNKILPSMSGLKEIQYQQTEKKNEGFLKLRRDYNQNTIEVITGNISTNSFNKAKKYCNLLNCSGYISTLIFMARHNPNKNSKLDEFNDILVNLNPNFKINDPNKLINLVRKSLAKPNSNTSHFLILAAKIHQKETPPLDYLLSKENNIRIFSNNDLIQFSKRPNLMRSVQYLYSNLNKDNTHLIIKINAICLSINRDHSKKQFSNLNEMLNYSIKNPKSALSYAITKAVAFEKGNLSFSDLRKNCYLKNFKRSGFFKRAKIDNKIIYTTSSLKKEFKNRSDLNLFNKSPQSRSHHVANSLKIIDELNNPTSSSYCR